MPLVASVSRASAPPPSYENTASWSAARAVMVSRAPGELISSSPLISTVILP